MEFLDLTELIRENKKRENVRLELFREILKKCHATIKNKNKTRVTCMYYEIPQFVPGYPTFDINALRDYLVYHLRQNGLKVIIQRDLRTIYISWSEIDLDLETYYYNQTMREHQTQNTTGAPGAISIETMKFRQKRQQELKEERERRFEYQQSRFAKPSRDSYLQRY